MYQTIKTDLSEGIYTITINRPDKLNALNKDVIEELGKALDEVYSNNDIKSAILTGEGAKAFVAGADITEFTDLDAQGGAALAKAGQDKVFSKIENAPKPVIAAVNGFSLGGGCEAGYGLSLPYRKREREVRPTGGQPWPYTGIWWHTTPGAAYRQRQGYGIADDGRYDQSRRSENARSGKLCIYRRRTVAENARDPAEDPKQGAIGSR